jgi:hypothetical protein
MVCWIRSIGRPAMSRLSSPHSYANWSGVVVFAPELWRALT